MPEEAQRRDIPTTSEIIRVAARERADRPAIIMPELGTRLTYAEFDRRIESAVGLLQDLGLEAGDRFGYLGRNNDSFYVMLFAAMRGGFVLVALNWRCVAAEIAFFLADSAPKLVFADAGFRPVLDAALAEVPQSPLVIATEGDEFGPSLRTRLDTQPRAVTAIVDESRRLPCLLLYTSGTSGRPKGVVITAEALTQMRRIDFATEGFPGGADETYLVSSPAFHIGGITVMMLGFFRQATCILTADASAANQIRLCRDYGVTITWMVPTVIRDFVDRVAADGVSLPSLRFVMYGGAPIPPDLMIEAQQLLDCGFANAYGMTEIAGSATLLPPADHDPSAPVIRSVGRAAPGVEIEIRGPDGKPLPPGVAGEIWIRTPTMMSGYWNRPDATEAAIIDGWYRTGDGAVMDEAGYIFLTDRIKDMIVSGGENVYPIEVENALRPHPAVADVAVVGIPDRRWGEQVTAVVECRAGESVDAASLIAFARERLAAYKCPKQVYFVDSLPRTASGKVQRAGARRLIVES